MPRLIRAVVAVLAASCLVVGCQPSAPMPTPSPSGTGISPSAMPTPTFLCTPEAGGDESPCTQAQYDEMKAKDALYAEAEEVYRRFFTENIRISRSGGVTEPTQVMLETSDGKFLDHTLGIFRDLAAKGLRARGEDPTITVTRAPGVSREGSVVALLVCVDASSWAFYRGDEKVSSGRPAEDRVYLAETDGDLRLVFVEGRWVESCA